MKKTHQILVVIALLAITALSSCKKDKLQPDPEPNPDLTFEEVIEKSGDFPIPMEDEQIIVGDEFTQMDDNNIWTCTTTTYQVSGVSGGNEGFPLFDIASDVIYPGSMLQGNSLHTGNPNPIVVERAGGTISTNILDGNLQSTFEVEEVTKSSITNAMNNIIASATGTLPSNFFIEVSKVQSREQFAFALGVDVNSTFVDLESNLGYNASSEKSACLVRMNQSFYTMSFDLPTSLSALFASGVTPQDLAQYVSPNNPATYISSVTYGRVFYMLIESSASQSDLFTTVNTTFNGVTTDVNATLDVSNLSSLSNVTYSVFAYGGDAGPTFDAVGETDVNELTNILSMSSTLGSAKPLSYVVRSVKDNTIVATQLATTYDVVDCEISGSVGTIPSIAHWSANPIFDDFGGVAAAYWEGDKIILLNEAGQWLRSTYINGVGNLEGPFGPISGYPLNGVGATCKIYGPDHEQLVFFGSSGTNYSIYNQTNQSFSTVLDVSQFYYNATFMQEPPFSVGGIGALTYASREINLHRNIMFSANGESYVWYTDPIFDIAPSSYSSTYSVLGDWSNGELNGKIDGVGAAVGFTLTGDVDDEFYYVLFNKAGDKFVLYGDLDGTGAEVVGPFVL